MLYTAQVQLKAPNPDLGFSNPLAVSRCSSSFWSFGFGGAIRRSVRRVGLPGPLESWRGFGFLAPGCISVAGFSLPLGVCSPAPLLSLVRRVPTGCEPLVRDALFLLRLALLSCSSDFANPWNYKLAAFLECS